MFQRILGHHLMLADPVRMEAYERAIQETVTAGDVVADIGTGSGILAFMALKAGAAKVYAIEKELVIRDAERIAFKNGFQDRVVFIHDRSDRVELPEKVDVVTSELIGYFGLEENLNSFQIDARRRFLKPGGAIVPCSLELHLTPVESGTLWNKYVGLWDESLRGIDYSAVRESAANQRYVLDCSGEVLELAPSTKAGTVDFYKDDTVPTNFKSTFTVDHDGSLDGLLGHFEARLSPSVYISSAVGAPKTHWEQSFFPLSARTFVRQGDRIHVTFKVIPYHEEVFWEWQTSVYRGEERLARSSQSNFRLSSKDLRAGREDFRPELKDEARIEMETLGLMDGQRTIREIGGLLLEKFPEKFRSLREAMSHAASTARRTARID